MVMTKPLIGALESAGPLGVAEEMGKPGPPWHLRLARDAFGTS